MENEQPDCVSRLSDQQASLNSTLYNKALGLLARREHSLKELEQKLTRKLSHDDTEGDKVAAIGTVLDKLVERGLQSDERFTEAYINMRANKGYGPVRIGMELSEKGIANDLAQRFLDERQDWGERLVEAWCKKYKNSPPSDYAERARQMRFLHSRGYEVDVIQKFLNTL